MIKSLAMIGFTDNAAKRISEISEALPPETEQRIYGKDRELRSFVQEAFRDCGCVLFVSAAGIAVRSIAPFIRSKDRDPAVIVMDELGENLIPILSGHIGGANDMARELAEITGARPVITTGTDVNGKFAVDTWAVKNGFEIDDITKIKVVSSALIKGEPVGIFVEEGRERIKGTIPEELTLVREGVKAPEKGIYVGFRTDCSPFRETIRLFPKVLVIGAGCRRGMEPDAFSGRMAAFLTENGLSMKAVLELATIDIKKDEACMRAFCEKYGIGMVTFRAEELMEETGDFSPSDLVMEITGADNVSERAAFRAARLEGGAVPEVIMHKVKLKDMTAAVCEKRWECRFDV